MIRSIAEDQLLQYGGLAGRFEAEQENFVGFRIVQRCFEHLLWWAVHSESGSLNSIFEFDLRI